MSKYNALFLSAFIVIPAFAQQHFGDKSLYLSLDKDGVFRYTESETRDSFNDPSKTFAAKLDLAYQALEWVYVNEVSLQGITRDETGLRVDSQKQPALIPNSRLLPVLCSEIVGESEFIAQILESGLVNRGFNPEELPLFKSLVSGELERHFFDYNHPLRHEQNMRLKDLKSKSPPSDEDIIEYIYFERQISQRLIPEALYKAVMSNLSPASQRALAKFLRHNYISDNSFGEFFFQVGVVTQREISSVRDSL